MAKIRCALLALAFAVTSLGQSQGPLLSPFAETRIVLGGKKFSVSYYAPFMRGRKIFGGLIPYGALWRAGANAPTTFSVGAPLLIEDFTVPKGEWILTVIPDETYWRLIIRSKGGNLVGQALMKLSRPPAPIEIFKIFLDGEDQDGRLYLAWENTVALVRFKLK